jgi:16S rRNA (adenine1518-N6/adenine1519-N6)-dimethyltransferase
MKLHHNPRKNLGQHFLKDYDVIQKIATCISPQNKDVLFEIGPGLGAITEVLAPHCKTFYAIEKDRGLAENLRNKFSKEKNIKITDGDILNFDINNISPKKLRVVGNLPYNISTPVIFYLSKYRKSIYDMHLMLQKEVVTRIIAKRDTKQYGRLTLMTKLFFTTDLLFDIKPESFYPKPKVTSSFIRIIPREKQLLCANDILKFSDMIRTVFNQRRKMIKNTIGEYIDYKDFIELDINPDNRPENLSLGEFLKIYKYLSKK